ncbi:MAG: hypothetical protein HC803_01360 [Saprospiraceae bacterium]|nr:hypothetical protein [Saprospiraceae bacterium]
MLIINNKTLELTEEGKNQATRLVRAHRLWETYLVEKMGLTAEQIHEDAEKYEHILTDEILDEMEEKLGYPAHDPHGSPIPKSSKNPTFALSNLGLNQFAKIESHQVNDHIATRLWELGLLPESEFKITMIEANYIEILHQENKIKLPKDLSKRIGVTVI